MSGLRQGVVEGVAERLHDSWEINVRGIDPHWDKLYEWAKDEWREQALAAVDAILDYLEANTIEVETLDGFLAEPDDPYTPLLVDPGRYLLLPIAALREVAP
jgi:hypothetical protein